MIVRDVQGNSAKVEVEYPRPPPKCLNCGRYGHLLSRCPKPLLRKLPYKKAKPSGSKEVNLSSTAIIPSVGTDCSLKDSEKSKGEAASSRTKRRRSRSKKRSNSMPPKMVDVSAGSMERCGMGTTFGEKLKWVAKSDIRPASSIPSSSNLSTIDKRKSVIQNQIPVEGVEIQAGSDKLIGQDFPFPPDWESQSNKSKKKQLKIWHNQMRSASQLAQAAVRDEVPQEPSLH